jgi:hypothetical protein
VEVDHSTIHSWVLSYAPELDKRIRPYPTPTNDSWRHTFQFVSDNHLWHEPLFLQRLTEKSLRCLSVSMSLQQDIQHVSFTVHRPPQIVLLFFDCYSHLIKMPVSRQLPALVHFW